MVIEAKSGSQSYDAALHQLKCYRAALKRKIDCPMLIWGIIEQSDETKKPDAELNALRSHLSNAARSDTWIFSSARDIPEYVAVTLMPMSGKVILDEVIVGRNPQNKPLNS